MIYKYIQGSNDPWCCVSCCSKIFPFGKPAIKKFRSVKENFLTDSTSNTVKNNTNNVSIKSSLSLKPLTSFFFFINQFYNLFLSKKMPLKIF